jgi:hypothetical protein
MQQENEQLIKQAEKEIGPLIHYYGDYVRRLFLAGAFIWVAILPFVHSLIPVPMFLSVLGILILVIAAGLTNPMQYFTVVLNVIISLIAIVAFEWYALNLRAAFPGDHFLFWVYELLTLNFVFALYFSVKTLRKK